MRAIVVADKNRAGIGAVGGLLLRHAVIRGPGAAPVACDAWLRGPCTKVAARHGGCKFHGVVTAIRAERAEDYRPAP
jgi:hypothetical protein